MEYLKYFLRGYDLGKFSEEYLLSAIETVKTRSKTLVEMAEMIEFYLVEEVSYDLDGAKKFLVPEIKPLLQKIKKAIKFLI